MSRKPGLIVMAIAVSIAIFNLANTTQAGSNQTTLSVNNVQVVVRQLAYDPTRVTVVVQANVTNKGRYPADNVVISTRVKQLGTSSAFEQQVASQSTLNPGQTVVIVYSVFAAYQPNTGSYRVTTLGDGDNTGLNLDQTITAALCPTC